MIGPDPGPRRFFCGRIHRPPLVIRFLDWWGIHKELYRVMGKSRIRTRWVTTRFPAEASTRAVSPRTMGELPSSRPGRRG